jgi:hypothetical protein
MKLTKGKISKLYKVKKQSLKRKNKNKNKKSKHHTFRKHKKLNLARKTLKKYRGGADESSTIQIVDKPFNSRSGTITNTNYIVKPDGKLNIVPNAAVPNAAVPNAAVPNAEANAVVPIAVPNAATTPNAATPNAATPNAVVPIAVPNAATPNAVPNAVPNAATPKSVSLLGSKPDTNSGKTSNTNTNSSYVSNQEPSKNINPRDTTIMVVDQLYKEVHDNDKQNASQALKGFVNEMAKPMPVIENAEPKPPANTNAPLLTNS